MFRQKLYDKECLLSSGRAVVTSSAMATNLGTVVTFDTGGGFTEGYFVVNTMALGTQAVFTAASGQEVRIQLRGSKTSACTYEAVLAEVILAAAGHPRGDPSTIATVDLTTAQRFVKPFTNEWNGTVYRYLRCYHSLSGTWTTGIAYEAYLTKKA